MLAQGFKGPGGTPFTYINSGRFYRAITYGCLEAGIDTADSAKVLDFAQKAAINYRDGSVFLENIDVTDKLHTDEIDRLSSPLSAIVPVRHVVNDLIRSLAGNMNLVVEGRDMTTVVFPQAEWRFYLDASVDSRAERRFGQGTSRLNLGEIREAIQKRDDIDKNKEEGSLFIAPGVHYLDTSDLTINQVYDTLINIVQMKLQQ